MAAGETVGDRERERGVVLVPIDFEDASRRALDLAKGIAPCLGAEVVLLHAYQVLVQVVPSLSPAEIPPLPGVHLEVEEAARRALNELADAHGGLRSILMEGDPASAILAEAERLRPRMVVMGTHGRAGLERVVLGSVAEKVVRRCVVPVTVVRAQ
jgi:nucleotide-binding universal stress UspA family protein